MFPRRHTFKSLSLNYRSSRRTLLGLVTMSIIIFSGESSQLLNVFRSTCKHEQEIWQLHQVAHKI